MIPPGFIKTKIMCPICGRRFVARNGPKIICLNTECGATLSPKSTKKAVNERIYNSDDIDNNCILDSGRPNDDG